MNKGYRKLASVAVLVLAVSALAAPAVAHRGHGSGRKAMGTVTSFDGTTLTVTETDGTTVHTATATEDTQVKVENRGHRRGKHASNGSLADLTAGTYVLKMKVAEDGTLEKIRVRSAAPHTTEDAASTCPVDDAATLDVDESDCDDTVEDETTEDADESETEDSDDVDDTTTDDTGDSPEA